MLPGFVASPVRNGVNVVCCRLVEVFAVTCTVQTVKEHVVLVVARDVEGYKDKGRGETMGTCHVTAMEAIGVIPKVTPAVFALLHSRNTISRRTIGVETARGVLCLHLDGFVTVPINTTPPYQNHSRFKYDGFGTVSHAWQHLCGVHDNKRTISYHIDEFDNLSSIRMKFNFVDSHKNNNILNKSTSRDFKSKRCLSYSNAEGVFPPKPLRVQCPLSEGVYATPLSEGVCASTRLRRPTHTAPAAAHRIRTLHSALRTRIRIQHPASRTRIEVLTSIRRLVRVI